MGVGIDDEDRFTRGIQQYRIGGLRSDTVNRKQLCAQGSHITSEELIKVVITEFSQPLGQGLEF